MVNIKEEKGLEELIIFFEEKFPVLFEHFYCPLQAIVLDFFHNLGVRKELFRWDNSNKMFTDIEIETINRCNSDCSFCPVNRNSDPRSLRLMDEQLFLSIISQLSAISYSGTVCFNGNNEPLLDKRIPEFIRTTREKLPNAFLIMYTNGSLLTPDLFDSIIPHLNQLYIDNYNNSRELNDRTIKILKHIKDNKEINEKIFINIIRKKAIRTTRGGTAPNRTRVFFLRSPCIYPFSQINVRSDGKVILCCNDALGRMILGDANLDTLLSIWEGNTFQKVRDMMRKGRQLNSICKNCDVFLIYPDFLYSIRHFFKK